MNFYENGTHSKKHTLKFVIQAILYSVASVVEVDESGGRGF